MINKHDELLLRDLRLQHFSAHEAQVFFQQEDSYDNYMLAHLKLAQDQSLDASQRQQAQTANDQPCPTLKPVWRHGLKLKRLRVSTSVSLSALSSRPSRQMVPASRVWPRVQSTSPKWAAISASGLDL